MLSARERLIVELRFGLVAGRCKTQREIAQLLGISRSYREVKKALRLLRGAGGVTGLHLQGGAIPQ
ncbi:MAG: sigma factor-like helix-turn-helix DNA-binding protein [Christensenellales bacterium]